MAPVFVLSIIMLSLAMQAFFAASEMGIISSNKIKISHLALQGDNRAGYLEKLLKNPERLLGTTLVGVNIAVIVGSSMAAGVASRFFESPETAAAVSTAVMMPLVLVFGQIIPMSFARRHSLPFSLKISLPLKFAYYILFPLVFFAGGAAEIFSKAIGGGRSKKSPFVTRDEFKLLIKEGMKKGIVDEMVMDMAYEIFDFGETDAEDIMVPLDKVVTASREETVQGLSRTILETGYSWIPVYGETRVDIVGVVKATDLLVEDPSRKAMDVMRPCYLVRDNELLEDVLKKMQQDRINFATVSDSKGGLKGIVTQEDIIEEIVGEIEDEYKKGRATWG